MQDWWNNVMTIPGARWIIYPCILLVLVLVAYYIAQLFRNLAIGGGNSTDDHLGSFRKMRDEGMIAPEEYKKLAGLVPLPETTKKESLDPDDTGAQALTDAAKAAIRKAAAKKSAEPGDDDEESENEDREQSTES